MILQEDGTHTPIYETHVPEHWNLHQHECENLKPCKDFAHLLSLDLISKS